MKRQINYLARLVFTSLFCLLFFGSASAQKKEFKKIYYPSLKVMLDDPSMPLVVSVDGKMYGKVSRSIQLDKMTSGRHLLTVYRVKIKKNGKKKYYEYFTGYVRIKPEVLNVARVNRRGYLHMTYRPLEDPEHYSQRKAAGSDPKIYKIQPKPKYKKEYSETSSNFGVFMQKLDETDFESEKLRDLDAYLKKSEGITTSQVSEVMSSFQFESSKIDVLKIAKKYVLDPDNLVKLRSQFELSANIDEFEELISEYN